jgi:hypothetical protein
MWLKTKNVAVPSAPGDVVDVYRALPLEQPPLDRRDRGVRAVVRPQLVHRRGDVRFHRALADAQRGGDLLVRQPLADEPQDGPLAVAEQTG